MGDTSMGMGALEPDELARERPVTTAAEPAGGRRRFPSPFEIETPPGAEGWERLYQYYYLFSEDRREFEEGKFWFYDGMHNPEPIYPFDSIMTETWWIALNQYTTRVYVVPPALGIDQRIVNGYIYLSPNVVEDPHEVARRAELFSRRAGYYFEHWDEIYRKWIGKAEDCIERLKAITFAPLPELEPEEAVTESRALTSGHQLVASYSRLLENMHEMAHYHFEMLGLGYGAYLTFRDFCQKAFPGIPDQTVAKMVAGIDIIMFRPDDELRKLARLALELGVDGAILEEPDPDRALEQVRGLPRGGEWLEALEQAKEPWFWFSTGPGYSHTHRAWMDDMAVPFTAMRGYIERLRRGDSIDRPLEEILAERERTTAEYRALLPTDEDRLTFDKLVQLARTVYPYVENHNFYVEHWHHSIFWNKVRELGRVFEARGFLDDGEDIFLLHRYEVYPALWDLLSGWATGSPDRGAHWRREVAERRRIMEALRNWAPPPALGRAPEVVTEPFTVMLWGITTETVERWLGATEEAGATKLHGIAASPGVVEGPARVITSPNELDQVETGDILVCPITAPSWAPVFARIKAAVSDIGGIMAHAAIVSREYGLPAVVGTGFATKAIATGQRIRVDGGRGVVEILG